MLKESYSGGLYRGFLGYPSFYKTIFPHLLRFFPGLRHLMGCLAPLPPDRAIRLKNGVDTEKSF